MTLSIGQDCNINKCNQECVSICPQNKRGKEAIRINKNRSIAEINNNNCIECYRCVSVCPLQAIKVKDSHVSNDNRRKKRVDQNQKNTIFQIDEDIYTQMSERNTVFARVGWDEDFEGYHKGIFENAHKKIEQGIDGYSEIELSAVKASWKIENIITYMERQQRQKKGKRETHLAKNGGSREKTKDGQTNLSSKQTENTKDESSNNEQIKYPIEDPAKMTWWLKKIANFYGCDLIGITPLDKKWLYSEDRTGEPYNFPKNLTLAIVIAVEMDIDAINTTPKMPSAIATGLGYSKLAFLRTLISDFVENLGYQAIPAGNQGGLSVPLAVLAGLGGYGRMGLLITKEYGPRVRVAKILTDMPLIPDEPDYKFIQAVKRFCMTCKTCAERCPSNSIPLDDEPTGEIYSISNNPGVKDKFYINVDTCYMFWHENGVECSRCIADCEYNHEFTLPHKCVNWLIMNVPFLNRIWPRVGKLLGYGGNKSAKKFWEKYQ